MLRTFYFETDFYIMQSSSLDQVALPKEQWIRIAVGVRTADGLSNDCFFARRDEKTLRFFNQGCNTSEVPQDVVSMTSMPELGLRIPLSTWINTENVCFCSGYLSREKSRSIIKGSSSAGRNSIRTVVVSNNENAKPESYLSNNGCVCNPGNAGACWTLLVEAKTSLVIP